LPELDPDDERTVAQIRTPMLVTSADNDNASSNAKELFDVISAPKQCIHFTEADGAGMHCEVLNRSMADRQIFDWVGETLADRGN
jgi:hypothetical protein